jgi:hypothetical protein
MLDFLIEGFIESFAEILFEPFRLLIHWIVRSLGGNHPRYFRVWAWLCRIIIWLSVLLFFGTIGSIIYSFIGPITMLWLFLASFVVFVIGTSALNAVEGTT